MLWVTDEKPVCASAIKIEEVDFCISFDAIEKAWTVAWKWSDDAEPDDSMAIVQVDKDKVRPVMDFRELKSHVDAFTASVDVCADKLRDWRRLGTNVSIVDLRRAYLQI